MRISLRHRLMATLRQAWLQLLELLEERTLFAFCVILLSVIGVTALAFSFIEANNSHPIWRSVVYVMSGMDVDPPETPLGQFFATLVLFSGIVLVSLLTGYIAAGFSNLLLSSRKVPAKPRKRVFQNHIVIFGWGAKTKAVLRELNESYAHTRVTGPEIVVVSNDEFVVKGPESIYKHVWHVRGTQADNSSLRLADLSPQRGNGARVAAILSDNTMPPDEADRKSLLTVLAVEHAHPPIHSIAEVQLHTNQRHFRNANVNETVSPNYFTSLLLARTLEYPGVASYIDELLALAPPEEEGSNTPPRTPISVFAITAKEANLVDRTISAACLEYYRSNGSLIVGIIESSGLVFLPDIEPAMKLQDSTRLAIVRRPAKGTI